MFLYLLLSVCLSVYLSVCLSLSDALLYSLSVLVRPESITDQGVQNVKNAPRIEDSDEAQGSSAPDRRDRQGPDRQGPETRSR